MYANKHINTKVVAVLLAVTLLLGCGIGGTIAWLMDTTDSVTNTFTVGNVDITLTESVYDYETNTNGDHAEGQSNSYPLIPGNAYKKDPKVTVAANSEDCWLFVKLDKVNNPDNYLTYTFKNDGWTSLDGEEGVYYREVKKANTEQSWDLLTADTNGFTVTVKNTIVKDGTTGEGLVVMPSADAQPQLIFTAYAVQTANRTVAEAWDLVKP